MPNRLLLVALLLPVATGCEPSQPDDDWEDSDLLDEVGARIFQVAPGDTLSGIGVERIAVGPEGPSREDIIRGSFIVQVPVRANQTVALVIRGDTPGVDAFGVVYDGIRRDTGTASEQALIPSLAGTDALFAYHSDSDQTLRLWAAGGEIMNTSGDLSVDVVALSEDPKDPLNVTNARVRAYHEALAGLEAERLQWLEAGIATEGADGRLQEDGEANISLRQRAKIRHVNDLRDELFEGYAESTGADADAVARACFELWQQF